MLVGMGRLTIDQRPREHVPGGGLQIGRDLSLDRLDLGLQLKPEVHPAPLHHKPLMLTRTTEDYLWRAWPGVLPDQIIGEGGPFDASSGHPKAVCEIPQVTRDCAPAPGHRRLRN